MYDPVIGRVLSPDIAVQAPGYTQSYNRYSYCMNNPLKYTDPSGWYVATGTDFGRDIIDMSGRGVTFYDYGIGSPGNFYSGGGSNSTIGPQGYRYIGGGVYLDVATGDQVDYSTVSKNYVKPNSDNYLVYQTAVLNADGKFVGNGHYGVIKEGVMHSDGTYPTFDSYTSASNFIDGFKSNIGNNFSGQGGRVDFGNYKITSGELKERLNDFANQTGYNVTVVGGDRNAARNASVGGSKGSRHISGDAADIVVRGTSNRNVAIQAHNSNLFNTTIYYPNYNTPGALPPHVHVDLNPGHDNVLMIYKIVDGSNKYLPWNP